MRRDGRSVFVSDDVRSELGENIDFSFLLCDIGFKHFADGCPNCLRDTIKVIRGLLVTADAYGNEMIRCTELTADDFQNSSSGWHLKDHVISSLK